MAVGSTRRELHAIEKHKRTSRFKMRVSFAATAAALGSVIAVTAVAAVYNSDQPSITAEPFSTPVPTLTGLGTPDQGDAVAASEEEVAIMAAAELITVADTIAAESPEVLAARKDLEELVASFSQAQDPALINELTGRNDSASRDQNRADLAAVPEDEEQTQANLTALDGDTPSAETEQTQPTEEAQPETAKQDESANDAPAEEPAGIPAVVTLADIEEATLALEALLGAEGLVLVTSVDEIKAQEFADAWREAETLADSTAGYSNGQIPASALSSLSFAKGHMARADAALMLELLNDEFKATFGHDIGLTDSYRSYASQVVTKANKGYLAATPGRSNHGWGLALDLRGKVAQWGTAERNWLVQNGSKYGWISPSWAQRGNGKEEPWHWEFEGSSVSAAAQSALSANTDK